jgi:hypothetical protein
VVGRLEGDREAALGWVDIRRDSYTEEDRGFMLGEPADSDERDPQYLRHAEVAIQPLRC